MNLAGKTVMPMIIDTHIHAPDEVAQNVRDMKRRAYWGISAAMSMGTETKDTSLKQRSQDVQGQAKILSAGRGITGVEKGREQAAYWVANEMEARERREGERRQARGHHQDLGRRPRRHGAKTHSRAIRRDHR